MSRVKKITILNLVVVLILLFTTISFAENENYNITKLQKEIEIQDEIIVETDNKNTILSIFNENKKVEEDGYTGILKIQNDSLQVEVNETYEEEYKVYMQKTYEKINSNELNDIPKEIVEDGIVYYLINPVWEIDSTLNVEQNEIPLTYNGIMNYEGIKLRTIIKNYKATITYKGTIEKEIITPIINNEIKQEEQEIKEDSNIIAPVVATASGIMFFSGIIIWKRKKHKK